MEVNAGKLICIRKDLPALAYISCSIQSSRENSKMVYLLLFRTPTWPSNHVTETIYGEFKGNLSDEDGDGKENVIAQYKFAFFLRFAHPARAFFIFVHFFAVVSKTT